MKNTKITARSIIAQTARLFYTHFWFCLKVALPGMLFYMSFKLMYWGDDLCNSNLLPLGKFLSCLMLFYFWGIYAPRKLVQKFLPAPYLKQSFWKEIRRIMAWSIKFTALFFVGLVYLAIIHGFIVVATGLPVPTWMPLEWMSVVLGMPGQELMEYGLDYLKTWKEAFLTPYLLIEGVGTVGILLLYLRVSFGQILAFTSEKSTFGFSYDLTRKKTFLLLRIYLMAMMIFTGIGFALHPVYTLVSENGTYGQKIEESTEQSPFGLEQETKDALELVIMPIKAEGMESRKDKSLWDLSLSGILEAFFMWLMEILSVLGLIVLYQRIRKPSEK